LSIYTTKLEPILPKILENWKIAARFARGIPPRGSPPDGGAKPAKFLFIFF
jgi:hypothetical protein